MRRKLVSKSLDFKVTMRNATSVTKFRCVTAVRAIFIGGVAVVLLLVWTLQLDMQPAPLCPPLFSVPSIIEGSRDGEEVVYLNYTGDAIARGVDLGADPPDPTFYDDPTLSYSFEEPVANWSEKRVEWLRHHPSFILGAVSRVLVVTGSQLSPCKNPVGDNLLLRTFKNKVDYCRIHGYDVFYNNVLFHPKMTSYWSKIPLVRAAMMAHPEVEWIFWVDSDAIFTDMEFKIPLEKYKNYNLVFDGWPDQIFEKKSWVGLNAGVFLMRNSQWSIEFMDVWASMGPTSPNYEEWGRILSSTFKDKMFPISDDQTALAYLLLRKNDTWGKKIYVENKYTFRGYTLSGYWRGVVDLIDGVKMEEDVTNVTRRHTEKVTEYYAKIRETRVKEGDIVRRPPFITHFTGCQPCSGDHNPEYTDEDCWNGMRKVLNFADNQVLVKYGYTRTGLKDTSPVIRN